MAARPGFEPRLTDSESAVLPLDDLAKYAFNNARKLSILQSPPCSPPELANPHKKIFLTSVHCDILDVYDR